jgi:hypothetical protein
LLRTNQFTRLVVTVKGGKRPVEAEKLGILPSKSRQRGNLPGLLKVGRPVERFSQFQLMQRGPLGHQSEGTSWQMAVDDGQCIDVDLRGVPRVSSVKMGR